MPSLTRPDDRPDTFCKIPRPDYTPTASLPFGGGAVTPAILIAVYPLEKVWSTYVVYP
jgi:hypothetical protein